MENNDYNNYNVQAPQTDDPEYMSKASSFLTKAIVSCVLAGFPIGSIVAIFLGHGNAKAIVEYLSAGGLHTPRIKLCSILSKVGKFYGLGMSIFWLFYLLYIIFVVGMIGVSAFMSSRG